MSRDDVQPASLVAPSRFAWLLWVACSIGEVAVYLFFTDLRLERAFGLVLVSSLVVQAVLVAVFVRRSQFRSHAEAGILGAASGVALAGVMLAALLLTEHLFRTPATIVPLEQFQPGYVLAILLIAGLFCGGQLGFLRWRLPRSPGTTIIASADSAWRRYGNSALLWVAAVTICSVLENGYLWGASGASVSNILLAVMVIGAGGLPFIPSIPLIVPASPSAGRRARVWKYMWTSLVVLVALWIVATALAFAAQSLLAMYLVGGSPYLLLVWAPCSLWALLQGIAEAPAVPRAPADSLTSDPPTSAPTPGLPSRWTIGSWALGAQASAFLLGLLTAAPPALGLQGVGCLTSYSTNAAEYRFWEAYKGIETRSRLGTGMIFRPAIDATACLVLYQKDLAFLQDARQLTLGYGEAARSWYWLIDPDTWDSPRTKQIRQALAGLVGRQFGSYAQLQEWWNLNNEDLVWSGSGVVLEARPKTARDLAHPRTSERMHYPTVPPSAVEIIRQRQSIPERGMGSREIEDGAGSFRAALLDPEARLRGLRLVAADAIEVLSGEHERSARAFLERLTGQQLATRTAWQAVFAVGHPPVPWRMSRASALEWIGLIDAYGKAEPYRSRYVEWLRDETGLPYSSPDAFVPWLQNPEHTRADEWLKGRDLANGLADDGNRQAIAREAMDKLRQITEESFGSPEGWIAWWQRNHLQLGLSRGQRRLVTTQ